MHRHVICPTGGMFIPHIDMANWQNRAWRMVPRKLVKPLRLLIAAGERWAEVCSPQLGASIAFYTMFALAPLLVIMIAAAGAIFGADAAHGQIVGEIEGLVGTPAANAIEAMIESAWRQPDGLRAAIFGTITMLIGATGVFGELRRALNLIGKVTPVPWAIGTFLRVRLTAFALLLAFGFLSIASLMVSAALVGFTSFVTSRYSALNVIATVFDISVSMIVLSISFAALIRWLPDRPPTRRSLWISAVASAVLFTIGKSLIGIYLGRTSVSSSYGAAGSFVVIMLWVYYSSQILLFGAALGRVNDEYESRRDARAAIVKPPLSGRRLQREQRLPQG